MSDPQPRKIGSLRDRIAAFENKGTAAPAPAPPPPRPKPAHITWQPKPERPTSPKSLSGSSDANAGDDAGNSKPAGMSAADAKESIGKLSLRERMAALQGSTAFGGATGGGAPPPPRPTGEKPKWKPPPVVQRVEPIGGDEGEETPNTTASLPVDQEGIDRARLPPREYEKTIEEGVGEQSEEGGPSPEEEERQRRAALVARMARLGGARVGMGPPIFAKKPDTPHKKLSEDISPTVPSLTKDVPGVPFLDNTAAVDSPPSVTESKAETSNEYFSERKDSGASSLTPESSITPTPVRSPHMPVPQVPKRAAPPRKRPVKSPSPAPPVLGQQESPSSDFPSFENPQDQDEAIAPPAAEHSECHIIDPETRTDHSVDALQPTQDAAEESIVEASPGEPTTESAALPIEKERPITTNHAGEPIAEEQEVHVVDQLELTQATHDHETDANLRELDLQEDSKDGDTSVPEHDAPAEGSKEGPEEEEAERRKRIAERIAKSGGFNPFTGGMPNPVRKESIDPVRPSASPPQPVRRDSEQEVILPKPSLPGQETDSQESGATRKSSLDVRAENDPIASSPVSSHELSQKPIDEVYEDEEGGPRSDGNTHVEKASTAEPEYIEETEELVAPLPPPPRATRPPAGVPSVELEEPEEEITSSLMSKGLFAPPPPRRLSVPPPPPPHVVEDETAEEQQSRHDDKDDHTTHAQESQAILEQELVSEPYEPEEQEYEYEDQPSAPGENRGEDQDVEGETYRGPRPPSMFPSLEVPPLPPQGAPNTELGDLDQALQDQEDPTPPLPPPRSTRSVSQVATPLSISDQNHPGPLPLRCDPTYEREVLDDADGDPIDPGFYSPQRSAGSSLPATSPQASSFPLASSPPQLPQPPETSPPPQRLASSPPPPQRVVSPALERTVFPPDQHVSSPLPAEEENSEESEQARRRTIAERMAKLGGLRFGGPPPMPSVRRPPPPEPEGEGIETDGKYDVTEEASQEEEDEFARKQRIAARIAMQGGMRFGMLPGAVKPPLRVQHEQDEESARSLPPTRSVPVPLPPPVATEEDYGLESDYQHVSNSDHIEHEESELEEVTHEDAEEAPPPVPSRNARRASSGPPPAPVHSSASPLPVPSNRPVAPTTFTYPPLPVLQASPTTQTQGDFVVIDHFQSDEPPPPPPPPRAGRPPGRPPPHVPPTPLQQAEDWEAPSIDFGGETDLSLSGQWSEDSTAYPPPVAPVQPDPLQAAPPSRPPAYERHFTPEELQAQWGRVGVQVHEIAAAFFEKSKRMVIGDGSYLGFVNAVVGQVPNAVKPTGTLDSFGYLVYTQSAAAVQRRVVDILPGDVIVVIDAKFKGHKGLQSYHQSVGVDQPLVGVIGDFEPKKSKVKVYQANQHVGQQSVESVSYRLEDMKSGAVKIYRVLEA